MKARQFELRVRLGLGPAWIKDRLRIKIGDTLEGMGNRTISIGSGLVLDWTLQCWQYMGFQSRDSTMRC